jgi:hypothetical protein
MIMLMAHKRRLVGPIWGAILVLALQLFPNVVFAHPVRTHHLSAAVLSTPLAAEHQHHQRPENQVGDMELAALSQGLLAPAAFDHCADGCCGAGAGAGCCAAVVAGSASALAYFESAAEPIPLNSESCHRTQLETVVRPPRTLA